MISDAPQRAQAVNLMSAEDLSVMVNEQFLRAHLVYLSYNALEVPVAGNGILLHDRLIAQGVFTEEDYTSAVALVNSSLQS